MPTFSDSSEVYKYIGGIFEQATSDPQLGEQFAASGVVPPISDVVCGPPT